MVRWLCRTAHLEVRTVSHTVRAGFDPQVRHPCHRSKDGTQGREPCGEGSTPSGRTAPSGAHIDPDSFVDVVVSRHITSSRIISITCGLLRRDSGCCDPVSAWSWPAHALLRRHRRGGFGAFWTCDVSGDVVVDVNGDGDGHRRSSPSPSTTTSTSTLTRDQFVSV